MSHVVVPTLSAWLGNRNRCYLTTFKCNGNELGYKGVRTIVEAITMNNFGLLNCELFSNQNGIIDEIDNDSVTDPWSDIYRDLRLSLDRNAAYTVAVQSNAIEVLKYSRLTLFHSHSAPQSLPLELIRYILSFICPTLLSQSQRMRIYDYASDKATLPSLSSLPNLMLDFHRVETAGRESRECIQFLKKTCCMIYEK